jgi:hypothetical protein
MGLTEDANVYWEYHPYNLSNATLYTADWMYEFEMNDVLQLYKFSRAFSFWRLKYKLNNLAFPGSCVCMFFGHNFIGSGI